MQMSSSSAKRSRGKPMDGIIWGNLQDHIDLAAEVYAKLPIDEFFRLRIVCKEWNRVASDQKFLETCTIPRAIPSPYFILGGPQSKYQSRKNAKTWMLYYEPWAQRWSWTWLPVIREYELDGLLYDSVKNVAFNVHTRVFHKLPPFPQQEMAEYRNRRRIVSFQHGMTISGSTGAGRYSFQVFFLAEDKRVAWIYSSDSGSWSRKMGWDYEDLKGRYALFDTPVYYPFDGTLVMSHYSTDGESCIYNAGIKLDGDESGTEEEWVIITDSPYQWQAGREIMLGLNIEDELRFKITAFEKLNSKDLGNGAKDNWVLFDQMPNDVCSWMIPDKVKAQMWKYKMHDELMTDMDDEIRAEREIKTRFIGEYVLFYVGVEFGTMPERAVLYNIEQKSWEKVERPASTSASPRIQTPFS